METIIRQEHEPEIMLVLDVDGESWTIAQGTQRLSRHITLDAIGMTRLVSAIARFKLANAQANKRMLRDAENIFDLIDDFIGAYSSDDGHQEFLKLIEDKIVDELVRREFSAGLVQPPATEDNKS